MPLFRSLALALCVCSLLSAQNQTGEIQLEVRDSSGSPVEASGWLRGVASGQQQGFQTDSKGHATLSTLPFGRYRLEVSKPGFASQTLTIDVVSVAPIRQQIEIAPGSLDFRVDVVGTTPLPGIGLEPKEVPAPVQTGDNRELERSGAIDLSSFLNRRFEGVYLNEIQGNPFQADLNYRGYTASPLLGTPQGMSIYMDGVRLNQPFGDVVSWDLIPRAMISEVTLVPGSNPLFGLNTLGGALSLQTKDGSTHPGTTLDLGGGSFGRKTAELEHGGMNRHGFHWYLGANLFFEDGWRDDSPTNVRQFFGKIGWRKSKTIFGLSTSYANNSLIGNGIQEQRFLDRSYSSVYTKPDETKNRSPFANFTVRHAATSNLTFSSNAYYRYIRTRTLNGDINEDALDQAVYQPNAEERAALTAAGYTGFPISGENATNTPFPYWRCIAQSLLNDEPAEKCNGMLNRGKTEQQHYGAAGQLNWFKRSDATRNQLTAGFAFDRANSKYQQSTQLGYLNPDRSVTGVESYADGVNGGEENGVPSDARVDLHGATNTWSLFGADNLSLGEEWNISLAGRYNRTTITNRDRIIPGGGPGSLDGHHVFQRFNPSAGITFSPARSWNLYFSYSEGSRAPTSIELGCADPEQPCKLPNAMAADPPLNQVVTRTFEAGVRGNLEGVLNWSAGWFHADNQDDILFVASQQTGYGYFRNFGKTRRQGFQLDLKSHFRRVTLGGGYTFLDSTFQSPESVDGSSNSTNEEAQEGEPGMEGLIQVQPGNKIPLIPSHMAKAFADFQVTSKFLVDVGLMAFSGSYARGNENNLHQPDGTYYLGPGRSDAYVVVNLGARYQWNRRLQFYVQVSNLFNRQYASAAMLGPTGFTNTGSFIARPFLAIDGEYPVQRATFYAPGAPIGAWGGVRLSF
jgi:outer membrane receptor protein involved in Fe transport